MDEDAFIKIINDKRDYRDIATYILNRFPTKFGMNDAIEIAEYFVKTHKLTKNEILAGKKDAEIESMLKPFLFAIENVQKPQEEFIAIDSAEPEEDIDLRTTKVKIDPELLIKFVAGFLSLSLMFGFSVKAYSDIKKDAEMTEDLGNIVRSNDYVASRKENGEANIAYHTNWIASDIVEKCVENIGYFDICLHNVYFDISYNRLKIMDEVFNHLKAYTKDEESMQTIYNRICNYDVFLEYLLYSGLIDINSEDYEQIKADIEAYKIAKKENSNAFNALPKDTQRRIEKLIDKYENLKDSFYKKYTVILEGENDLKLFEIAEDPNFGGRV